LLGRHASRVTWSLTLPVAPPDGSGVYSGLEQVAPRALSTGSAPTPPLSRPEAPSADEVPPDTPLAGAEGATCGPPLVPRFCRLGPASNTRSRTAWCARLAPLAGYSPEIASHVRPIDFCSCQEPRAQPRAPDPSLFKGGESKPPHEGDELLAKSANRASQLRGYSTREGPCNSPRQHPHAVRGFTPT
jgi:hypothetical protein